MPATNYIDAPSLNVPVTGAPLGARVYVNARDALKLFGLHSGAQLAEVIWVAPCGAVNLSAQGRDAMVRPVVTRLPARKPLSPSVLAYSEALRGRRERAR